MAYTSDSIENIIKSLTIGGKTYPLGVQYADKADSMNVTAAVGNSKHPVYLKADGTFAQTTYTLNKAVPANAKFTDTTYQLTLNGTTNGAGTTNLGNIYAPTSAGTNGQYLMSNGSGAPSWADFSTLLSPFLTEENLEGYNNSINIVTNDLDKHGFNVTNESYTASSTISYDGIYINRGNTHAWMVVGGDNILHFEAPDMIFDALNTTFTNNLSIRSTVQTGESVDITISAEVDETDPDNKTTIIDSKLEIGDELIFSKEDNSVEHATISTEAGGDLIFNGLAFEFDNTSADFIVNGHVYLKGAKNTGSATNPIYIDTNGQFQPTTYTLAKSVPSTAKFTDTTYQLTLNGTTNGTGTTNLGNIYAPTSGGTSGQYLKSNGTGAPIWVDLPDFSRIMIGTPEHPNMLNNENVVTIDSSLEIGGTIYLTNNYNDWVSISTEVDETNPDNKTTIIDSDLEIGRALYLSDNQTDYASIYTDGGGDLFFSGTNFEFPQSGNFVVNGPVSLKGAANTGSATNPIYIDNLGKIKPTTYTLAKSVPSTAKFTDTTYKLTLNGTTKGSGSTNLGTIYAPTSAGTNGQYLMSNGSGAPIWVNLPDINNLVNQISQLQSRISYLESIITSYIGPIN